MQDDCEDHPTEVEEGIDYRYIRMACPTNNKLAWYYSKLAIHLWPMAKRAS